MDNTIPQPRIALLIDADNAPADLIDEILTELSTLGVINIRRAYGNWTKPALAGWQARLLAFAIRPMQQFDYSRRKNASDMAMTVDAMELLYTERPDAFGIVSSDADFTPLVMHLRAKGAAVYGFGAAQTPLPFVNACSRFLYLEALAEAHAEGEGGEAQAPPPSHPPPAPGKPPTKAAPAAAPVRVPTAQLRQDTRLMNLLRDAAHAVQDEAGWATVGAVGTHISNKASFDPRNYGYATLSKLLAATEAFDLRGEGTSRVAVKARGRKAAAPAPAAHDDIPPAFFSPAPSPPQAAAPVPSPVRAWPVRLPRRNAQPLGSPELHALRRALLLLAAARVTVAQVLHAVPELAGGQACALGSVASRLREQGLLHTSRSALDVLAHHPEVFQAALHGTPQTVRCLAVADAQRADATPVVISAA